MFSAFNATNFVTANQQALHPLQPPAVTPLGNTLYRVDVEDTMPEFIAHTFLNPMAVQSAVGFTTVILKVTGQNIEKFYVLVSKVPKCERYAQ